MNSQANCKCTDHYGTTHQNTSPTTRQSPENTLAALGIADQLGADGIEFEVQQCVGGELVDFTIRCLTERQTGNL
jgi:hypothetical protein